VAKKQNLGLTSKKKFMLQILVSFVVGIDGHVYGPLVLEGTKDGVRTELARPVVDAVRQWRFRPAVCNGAPTEAEAKVEFSSPPNRF
jgi:outer membrane biosynthesis protein TonB